MLLGLLGCSPVVETPDSNAVWWDLEEPEQIEVALDAARLEVAVEGLGIGEIDLVPRRMEVDELDLGTLRLDQHHGGVRVLGGELIVHLDRHGELVGMSDYLVPEIDVSTWPRLSPISYSGDAGQYRLWIRMRNSGSPTDVDMCADWPT